MHWNQDRSAQHALSAVEHCVVLNVFRHKLSPDLFCAVPQDCPVPGFLSADVWRFVADAGQTAHAMTEIDAAATAGLRRTGYYFSRSPSALDQVREISSRETAPARDPDVSLGLLQAQPEFFIDCFA